MLSERFLVEILPKVREKLIDRVDKECEDAEVKVYWAGTIVRVDLKYKEPK